MIKYYEEADFGDLLNMCWGNASDVLFEIQSLDLEDEFMLELETIFDDSFEEVSFTDINDYISYDFDLEDFIKQYVGEEDE